MIYGPTDDNASPTWVLAVAQMDNKIPLMQFTGLLDRNGKEIYEGDILEGGSPIDGDPRRWTVKWYSTNLNAGWDFGYMPAMNYCEVIGNIHENPELLK